MFVKIVQILTDCSRFSILWIISLYSRKLQFQTFAQDVHYLTVYWATSLTQYTWERGYSNFVSVRKISWKSIVFVTNKARTVNSSRQMNSHCFQGGKKHEPLEVVESRNAFGLLSICFYNCRICPALSSWGWLWRRDSALRLPFLNYMATLPSYSFLYPLLFFPSYIYIFLFSYYFNFRMQM